MWPNILLAAHVWAQGRWNAYTAIGLLVSFKQGQHDARRGDGCVVEGVYKLDLAIFVAIAHIHPTRLPVVEVRARMCLAESPFAGKPALEVVHSNLAIAHVACTDIHDPVGEFECLHKLLRICQQLFMPVDRFLMTCFANY